MYAIRSYYASEASQRSLMSQSMNQIVQKAVLSLHNGQHEVELHLKPDFLGHIRMQIVSEGQHVAIKMVAELPFVKDMLVNNFRITSYNVCYTKLLRTPWADPWQMFCSGG